MKLLSKTLPSRKPSALQAQALASRFISVSLQTATSIPFSKHHFNNQPINTLFTNSSQQPKSALSSSLPYPISHNLTQMRFFSDSSSFFSLSKPHLFNAHFLSKLSKQPKPTFKSTFYESVPSKSVQRRSFSSDGPRPIPYTESSPPIDAGSSIRKPISLWPGMYHSPVSNALWEARSSIFEKPTTTDADGTELIAKTPSRSRTSILYKFSSDYVLREQYRNPWNEMRMGKLVEDLDALAGTISYKVRRLVKSFVLCLSLKFLNLKLLSLSATTKLIIFCF